MQAKATKQESDLSLNGLEELLNASAKTPSNRANSNETTATSIDSQDWTVEECSRALGLTRGAVIRRLEDGILPGYKVNRANRMVWRVKPIWLRQEKPNTVVETEDFVWVKKPEQDSIYTETKPEKLDKPGQMQNAEDSNSETDCQTAEFIDVYFSESSDAKPELPDVSYHQFQELFALRAKLEMTEFQFQDTLVKLESANYRLGYMQARLEASEEQIKLLTDSRANCPWWQRWRKWFTS